MAKKEHAASTVLTYWSLWEIQKKDHFIAAGFPDGRKDILRNTEVTPRHKADVYC